MKTWNERLAEACAESGQTNNALAKKAGVAAPTFSAWVGAGTIKPSETIGAHRLFSVCRELGVRAEWVLYGEQPKYERDHWPFAFSRNAYEKLPQREREEINEYAMYKISKSDTAVNDDVHTVANRASSRKLSSSIDEAMDAASHLLGSDNAPAKRKPRSSKPG